MIVNNVETKAIIFDWGGVCCSEGEPFASKLLQEKVGKHPNDICQDVLDLYYDFYRGKYSTEEFYKKTLEHYSLEQSEELNPKTMAQAYIDSTEIWQDVLDTAKKLQSKYRVALLSDLTPVMKDWIHAEKNIAEFFPLEVFSCDDDVQAVKTDGPKAFEITLQKLGGLRPEETLFVDNSKSKIKVAEGLGMNTLFFESREQFINDIKKYE